MECFWSLLTLSIMSSTALPMGSCGEGEILSDGRCLPCGHGYYKYNASSIECRKCGELSVSNDARTVCRCLGGHFRKSNESSDSSAKCYNIQPNFNVEHVSIDSVTIKWDHVSDYLEIGPISYLVQLKEAQKVTHEQLTRENKFHLTNLTVDTKYTIVVTPHIQSSIQLNASLSSSIEFYTKSTNIVESDVKGENTSTLSIRVKNYNKSTMKQFLANFLPPLFALTVIFCMAVRIYRSKSQRSAVMRKYHIVKEQQTNGRRDNYENLVKQLFADAWLLDVEKWLWIQLKIEGGIYEPPDLWCHASVLVQQDLVVFSEEKKCPHCRCPVQYYHVPQSKPCGDSPTCTCGRRKPEEMLSIYDNHLQMYILDCTTLFTDSKCRWLPYKYLMPAPLTRKLFSATLGMNEILLFGGLSNLNRNELSRSDDCTIVVKAKPSPS